MISITCLFNAKLISAGSGSSVPSVTPPMLALITDDPTIVLGENPLTGKNTDWLYSVNARLLSVIFIILSGNVIAAIISWLLALSSLFTVAISDSSVIRSQ